MDDEAYDDDGDEVAKLVVSDSCCLESFISNN